MNINPTVRELGLIAESLEMAQKYWAEAARAEQSLYALLCAGVKPASENESQVGVTQECREVMESKTETIVEALKILARDLNTREGVVEACLIEAAHRLVALQDELDRRKEQLIETTTLLDKVKADKKFWFEKAKSENEAWLTAIAKLSESRKVLEDYLENKEAT